MAKNHFYDDPEFSYQKYWVGRLYEHQSEVIAIQKLLKNQHFESAADIGGGYGRLVPTLLKFCDQLTLVEPSLKQRQLALKITIPSDKNLKFKIFEGTSENTTLPDSSLDLAIVIRVLHHLPNPAPALQELRRILKPQGVLILEFANSISLKSRLKSLISGKPILLSSVEKRRPANIRRGTIPFVNHHPHTIKKLLYQNGFVIDKILSVSNFRVPFLKKFLPLKLLLILESLCQQLFSYGYIGPSIFILARLDNK